MKNDTIIAKESGILYGEPVGPLFYFQTRNRILNSGEEVPNGDSIVPLLVDIYQYSQSEKIREILQRSHLKTFDIVGCTDEQLYVIQHKNGDPCSKKPTSIELKEMLYGGFENNGVSFSPDLKVRAAPLSQCKFGILSPDQLKQDPGVIARFGIRGAKDLALLADNNSNLRNGVHIRKPNSDKLLLSRGNPTIWEGRDRLIMDFDHGFYEAELKGYAVPIISHKP